MDFLPFNMTAVQPIGGFKPYPEGFYVLQVTKTDEIKTVKSGAYQYRVYQSEIIMGPSWSDEFKGKKFYERLSLEEAQMGRHMDLFAACLGSIDAVRQMAAQNNGMLAPSALEGHYYMVQISVNDSFNNVMQRLPYTEQAWAENVGGAPGAAIMTGTAPTAAAPMMAAAPVAAPMPMAPAPAPMAVAPAPVAAPPQMAAPAMAPAPAPVYAAPAPAPVPAPVAPPAAAPAAAPGIPAPPPPPGFPSGQ